MQSPSHPHESHTPEERTTVSSGKVSWYVSIILMATVLAGTIMLWGYGIWQMRVISSLESEIGATETKIAEASKDRNVLIAHIVSDPKKVRPSLDVADLIKKFRDAAELGDVRFQGFMIRQDVISTNLIANSDQYGSEDAVIKLIKMMRDHKQNVRVLSMKPVEMVAWDPKKRTTAIELIVIPESTIKK